MTSHALLHYIQTNAAAARALQASDSKERKTWVRVRPEMRRADFIPPLIDRNWSQLAEIASAEIQARRRDLVLMGDRLERLEFAEARNQFLHAAMQALETEPLHEPSATERRVRLEQKLHARNVSAEESARIIKQAEARKMFKPRSQSGEGTRREIARLHTLAEIQLAALMGANLAFAVARFNQAYERADEPEQPTRDFIKTSQADLARAEKSVWNALRRRECGNAFGAALVVARVAANALLKGSLQHAAFLAIRRRADSADTRHLGVIALEVGNLVRRCLQDLALGHALTFYTRGSVENAPLKEWMEAARELPFSATLISPPAASISSLVSKPATKNNKPVTVEGVLGPVTIVHRGRKAISSAALSDDKGRSIIITIPYIKLDSGGMVPGAYVRISGLWQKESKEVKGAALLIDRLNYGELSESNWRDWTTMRLRNVFTPVPHALAASWSWEPGADGAGNALRYGMWSALKEG